MANLNLSEFTEKLFVTDADHTFIWDTVASISKRVSRNSWLNSGTLTSDAPVTISQTWNAGTNVMTAFKVVATDTMSGATSNLLELWAGSTPILRFNVGKNGTVAFRSGNVFGDIATDGVGRVLLNASSGNGARVTGDLHIGSANVVLLRDGADNTLALRNGTSAQTFNVYGTSSSNNTVYERMFMRYTAASTLAFQIGTETVGATARPLEFLTAGTRKLVLTAIGNNTATIYSAANSTANILTLRNLSETAKFEFHLNASGNAGLYLGTNTLISEVGNSYFNGGNVGIGTASPTSKLHVVGDAFLAANGSNTAPSLRIGAGANINGWYSFGGVQLNGVVNSVNVLGIASSGINVAVGNITLGNAADVILERDAQDELALRRGALGQKFSVYGTYPNSTNWERFTITAPTSGNVLLGTYKGTGGVARGLEFQTDGVTRMSINSTGAVTFDSNVNINSSLRITFINNQTSALSMFVFSSDATGASTYALGGSAPLMRFGGTTDSFPAIARDNAGIKFTGGAAGSTAWVKVPPVAVTALPDATVAGVGARAFVNDALAPTFGSAVTGGGSVPVPVYSTGSAWNVG